MKCDDVRAVLMADDRAAHTGELQDHLEACAACAAFADRLRAAREAMAAHYSRVEPDAGFAARVGARLHRDPAADLGRVALRLLPATLAVLAALVWVTVQTSGATAASEVESPSDDYLVWVLGEDDEVTP